MLKKLINLVMRKPEIVVFIYFFSLASIIAYLIVYGIVPDEVVHYGSIQYYSRFFPKLFLPRQIDSFYLGEVSRQGSFLYYYLAGFFYKIIVDIKLDPLIFVRFFSVVFSTLTLIFLNKIAIFLNMEKKLRIVALFFIANVPMFLVISAGVNYDALVIMLATIICYLMLLLSKRITTTKSLTLFIFVVIGPLIKFAFAPISFSALVIYGYLFITRKHKIQIAKERRSILFINLVLLTVLLICSFVFAAKYIKNYLDYKAINPRCDRVLTIEQCKENFVYRRTEIYGKAKLKEPKLNQITYLAEWSRLMNERTAGILGHKVFKGNEGIFYISYLITMCIFIIFIKNYKFRRSTIYIVFVTIFYTICLILNNQSAFKVSQDISLAVQGRYLFPISFVFAVFSLSLAFKSTYKNRNSSIYNLVLICLIVFSLILGPWNIRNGINRQWIRQDFLSVFINN